MKIFILMMALLSSWAVQGRADDSTSFDYTGNYAIDMLVAPNDYVFEATSSPTGVGGPAGNDDNGYASQFTITAPTQITSLDVNAVVYGSPSPGGTSTTFDYQIYSGSTTTFLNPAPVPNTSTLVATSSPLTFANANATDSGINVPLNTNLQPGTYWLAEIGNGSAVVDTTQGYVDPSPSSNTAHTPELKGLIAMGLCALFILWRGRRYVERMV